MEPKLCYVEWVDINTDGGPWVALPSTTRPFLCRSIAWLLRDDSDGIQISATYAEGDEEGNHESALQLAAIPRGCIKRMEILTLETLLAFWNQ